MPSFRLASIVVASVALAGSFFAGGSAQAGTLDFSNFANGYETVDVTLVAPNTALHEAVLAGGLLASYNGGPSFTTYCVDLYDSVWFGTSFSHYAPVAGSAHVYANANANADIGRLFNEGHALTDAESQAAFQIAVWEIAYETSGHYDLGSGAAQFGGGTAASSGALSLAGSWLAQLPSVSGSRPLGVLESTAFGSDAKRQDQVFAMAVPEPSTYAMLTAGLLAVGFIGRRRGARRG